MRTAVTRLLFAGAAVFGLIKAQENQSRMRRAARWFDSGNNSPAV